MNVRFLPKLACALAPLFSVVACGDDTASPPTSAGTGDGGTTAPGACPAAPAPQKVAASCEVTLESPPVSSSARHLPEGTALTFCTNPPSGGDHYPLWAAFQEFTAPVDWGYLVHSMEHGGVVLAYKCDPPGCPEIVGALKKIRDDAAPDAACGAGGKRIIIVPSPTLPTKVAAAAWGKTYTAGCVDAPTLSAFVRDNYNKGPEDTCAPGRTF